MVIYEWICEQLDADGDVVDVNHFTTREEAQQHQEEGDNIGLTRDTGDEDRGLTDRLWAYVQADGTLPLYFSDSLGEATGIAVPKRFR